jgi:hypothetical protein
MKDFEPTDGFVSRVMAGIDAYESSKNLTAPRAEAFLLSRPVRYALSAGGVLLGIVNIFRMVSAFVAPALCR